MHSSDHPFRLMIGLVFAVSTARESVNQHHCQQAGVIRKKLHGKSNSRAPVHRAPWYREIEFLSHSIRDMVLAAREVRKSLCGIWYASMQSSARSCGTRQWPPVTEKILTQVMRQAAPTRAPARRPDVINPHLYARMAVARSRTCSPRQSGQHPVVAGGQRGGAGWRLLPHRRANAARLR